MQATEDQSMTEANESGATPQSAYSPAPAPAPAPAGSDEDSDSGSDSGSSTSSEQSDDSSSQTPSHSTSSSSDSLAVSETSTPPTFESYNFTFASHLLSAHRFGIPPTRPVCQDYKSGHCPLENSCPNKHPLAYAPPAPGSHQSASSTNTLICKHWLKGLCKKGDSCDFLHEWNIRGRSECRQWAATLGAYCIQGDDCNYLHPDPSILEIRRRKPCEWYNRGFCPLGPRCAHRHVKTFALNPSEPSTPQDAHQVKQTQVRLCKYYLTGFCPYGNTKSGTVTSLSLRGPANPLAPVVPSCDYGAHAKWKADADLPKPEIRIERSAEEMEAERERIRTEAEEREQRDWDSKNANLAAADGLTNPTNALPGVVGSFMRTGRGRGKRGFVRRGGGLGRPVPY